MQEDYYYQFKIVLMPEKAEVSIISYETRNTFSHLKIQYWF